MRYDVLTSPRGCAWYCFTASMSQTGAVCTECLNCIQAQCMCFLFGDVILGNDGFHGTNGNKVLAVSTRLPIGWPHSGFGCTCCFQTAAWLPVLTPLLSTPQ